MISKTLFVELIFSKKQIFETFLPPHYIIFFSKCQVKFEKNVTLIFSLRKGFIPNCEVKRNVD
ncbi:hypothetical protein B6D60_03325 [candidate division KSB1 bacterium 4484_87]|nr:MAG: hypothetical protein B6D60_03325 [candidate division KSB1 bacterium 4484_87]